MKDSHFKNEFEAEVYKGLTRTPKSLSSRFFYDKEGDKLFQKIMDLPEYYLSDKEYEILNENRDYLTELFSAEKGFDLIDLGAGDGTKTKLLLRHFLREKLNFRYLPVDISENILEELAESLKSEFPLLKLKPIRGTYSEVSEKLGSLKVRKKVILFLGSNIGNFSREEAIDFLRKIAAPMRSDDLLFIGFDQKKHPRRILDAYNDSSGITEAFNKNLLLRINRELEADFDPETFLHWPVYNPEDGSVKSYLVSEKKQKIQIKALNLTVSFETWESLDMEVSQKYDDPMVQELAVESGLEIHACLSDQDSYFKNYIFRKKYTS